MWFSKGCCLHFVPHKDERCCRARGGHKAHHAHRGTFALPQNLASTNAASSAQLFNVADAARNCSGLASSCRTSMALADFQRSMFATNGPALSSHSPAVKRVAVASRSKSKSFLSLSLDTAGGRWHQFHRHGPFGCAAARFLLQTGGLVMPAAIKPPPLITQA